MMLKSFINEYGSKILGHSWDILVQKIVIKRRGKAKVFCIGRNKTGTTSVQLALEEFGYLVGDQREAELMSEQYFNRDLDDLISYCKRFEAFQDFPFSFPDTYKAVDKAFPGSKFVLTIRDTPDDWFDSMLKFQTKLFSSTSNDPTVTDLKNANYVRKGWVWKNLSELYSLNEETFSYDKSLMTKNYTEYNNAVIDYFKDRKTDFIVINVGNDQDYSRLCKFLGKEEKRKGFPWLNKTSELK